MQACFSGRYGTLVLSCRPVQGAALAAGGSQLNEPGCSFSGSVCPGRQMRRHIKMPDGPGLLQWSFDVPAGFGPDFTQSIALMSQPFRKAGLCQRPGVAGSLLLLHVVLLLRGCRLDFQIQRSRRFCVILRELSLTSCADH